MTRLATFALLAATLLSAQQPGRIHGVVRDALTGTPLEGAIVRAGRTTVQSGPQGHFTFRDVPPGEVQLQVSGENVKSIVPKKVVVISGQEVTVDVRVPAMARISGVVTDAAGKPVPDAMVTAVAREYYLGSPRYVIWYSTLANDRGEFGSPSARAPIAIAPSNEAAFLDGVADLQEMARSLRTVGNAAAVSGRGLGVEAGRAFLLFATHGRADFSRRTTALPEPEKREPISWATWYIGSLAPEGAVPLTLSPAERRERLDIRMASGPGYCMLGSVRPLAPGNSISLTFAESSVPSQGVLGSLRLTQRLETDAAKPALFPICGLSPGSYRVTSFITANTNGPPLAFATQLVTISDRDVKVPLDGDPPASLSVEVVWDGDQPQPPAETVLTVQLRPVHHTPLPGDSLGHEVILPSQSHTRFDRVVADDYELQVNGIPPGAYWKDVTVGGRSLFHLPVPGTAGELRVVLGRDGGTITAQVPDADCWVVAMPASAPTPADLSRGMVWGRASSGTWISPTLAPGTYLVLATQAPVDLSVDAVERLFRARGRATEANLSPGANLSVKLDHVQ